MARLALNSGPRLCQTAFPGWPIVDKQDIQAVTTVLRNGRWGRLGDVTTTVEVKATPPTD